MNTEQKSSHTSYSLRKIPETHHESGDFSHEKEIDSVKILELSNIIDEWEYELLFSENGFFSLKGKEVENKTTEFCEELNKLINSKISQVKFLLPESREIFFNIKNLKINSLTERMKIYENEQLNNWIIDTYEQSINSSVRRAVLYKNNPGIVKSSYSNAMTVIKLMADKEKWDEFTYSSKISEFKSDFYYALISAFMEEKDILAGAYFEKYKDELDKDKQEEIKKSIDELKNNITAYNWSKELFSYNLSESEKEKEINSVRDKNIKSLINHYVSTFDKMKKKEEDREIKSKNESNWNQIISLMDSEPDKAELYIDYSLKEESKNAKKSYIKDIRNSGVIKTDIQKFLKLLNEAVEDIDNFREKDISDFHADLSGKDFEHVSKIKNLKDKSFQIFKSDYEYIKKEMKNKEIKSQESIYAVIKLCMNFLKWEENIEASSIFERTKLILSIIERYEEPNKSKTKEQDKKGVKNDSIKANTGE